MIATIFKPVFRIAALWLALASPVLASQATLVTPSPPLPMTSLAAFLNSAFLSIGSCNYGNSAPANGTGGAAFAGECWGNTTSNPIVYSYTANGTNWSEFGTLNTSTFVWTPYSAGTALPPIGTSGDTIPVNNGGFTQSGAANFTGGFSVLASQLATILRSGISGGNPVNTGTSDPNNTIVLGNQSISFRIGLYFNGDVWWQPSLASSYATNTNSVFNPNGGNVGIGVAPPLWPLHVNGSIGQNGSSSGTSVLVPPASGGGNIQEFAGSDTMVGRATTDTLINKTFNCANNTCTVRIASDVSGLGSNIATALGNALNASGGIIACTPSGAGSIAYWNGTAWTCFAGNTSGTQALFENASGALSWSTVSGSGTVTNVATGTGLSGGPCTSTCTITNTGILSITDGYGITGSGTTPTLAVSLTTASNVLGADVNLSTTSTYFDGPSMAQGTTGTWYASGTVSLADTGTTGAFWCKLWDGTTVISSAVTQVYAASVTTTMSLSGNITNPAGNIRISCRDSNSTAGKIKFNVTGNSADSSIFGHRIQ